jgi:hypothetical protein
VVGSIAKGRVVLDLRTVPPEQDAAVAQAVREALAPPDETRAGG